MVIYRPRLFLLSKVLKGNSENASRLSSNFQEQVRQRFIHEKTRLNARLINNDVVIGR